MSFFSQFGMPSANGGIAGQSMEGAAQVKRRMTALGVYTGSGSGVIRGHFSELSNTMGGMMGAAVFPNKPDTQGLGTTPISVRLVSVLQTSELDQQYYKYLQNSFVFSLFSKGDGISQPLHLNRCNAKLREDFEARRFRELYESQDQIMRAGPGAIGIGIKRKRQTSGSRSGTANSEYGLHDIKNVAKHVRFLGRVPTQGKHSDSNDYYFPTREITLTVQYSGRADEMANLWGNVGPGDYLSFHVTRINKISESSGFSTYEDFGPIQIVPVASRNKSVAFGSASHLHNFWMDTKRRADDIRNDTTPPEFGLEKYGPMLMRSGSTDPSIFSMMNPIRSITNGTKPCDAVHWGPRIINVKTRDDNVATTSEPETSQMLIAELTPNIVYHVGRVLSVPIRGTGGLSDEMRHEMLMDGSGQKVCEHTEATVSIQLEVFAH